MYRWNLKYWSASSPHLSKISSSDAQKMVLNDTEKLSLSSTIIEVSVPCRYIGFRFKIFLFLGAWFPSLDCLWRSSLCSLFCSPNQWQIKYNHLGVFWKLQNYRIFGQLLDTIMLISYLHRWFLYQMRLDYSLFQIFFWRILLVFWYSPFLAWLFHLHF